MGNRPIALILFALCCLFPLYGTVHILGDSNAPYNFTTRYAPLPDQKEPVPDTPEWLTYEKGFFDDEISQNHHLQIPYEIHWIKKRTMHRIGRDGILGFNILDYGVRENDVAVFVFGSIDQGGHIYRQASRGRELDEIVNTLVDAYLNTLLENRRLYTDLTVVILAVLPPRVDPDPYFVNDFKKSYPDRDFLEFQANVTYKLNETLEIGCQKNGFLFLNANPFFETAKGGLKPGFSDGGHHIDPKYNFVIKEKLISLIFKDL